MTNEQVIKENIDLVRRWSVVMMNDYKSQMSRFGAAGMYAEAERLKWMAEGIGLCVIKLGDQIGLSPEESVKLK